MLVPGLPISKEESHIISKFTQVYANAFTQLDIDKVGELFDEEVIFDSDRVINTLRGKEEVFEFLKRRWGNIKAANKSPLVEIAKGDFIDGSEFPCLIGYERAALISLRVEDNKITEIYTHTFTPDPNTARGSKIFFCREERNKNE